MSLVPLCITILLMFTIRIDIACKYVVSCWPSRDVKVIFHDRYSPVLNLNTKFNS